MNGNARSAHFSPSQATPATQPAAPHQVMRQGQPALRIRIDELCLPGYSVRDGERLGAGLTGELQRLLQQRSVAAESHDRNCLLLDGFRVIKGERPEQTGRRLARLLAGKLTS